MILRLPMQVKLYNADHELVESINSTKKSQVRLRLQALPRGHWQYGTCRVYYNKPNDFWNEFKFTNFAQLEAGLVTVTEKPLVDFLKKEITPQYLDKRKVSAKMLNVLRIARSRSKVATK